MISTIGKKTKGGFTILEMAIVIAIIFTLAGTLFVIVPSIEKRSQIVNAKGDIARLELGLGLYKTSERALPPDREGMLNVTTPTDFDKNDITPFSDELVSNVLLIHYLTTLRSRKGYLDIKRSEVKQRGTMKQKFGDSMLLTTSERATSNTSFPAFALLDPWNVPYVYDNNEDSNEASTVVTADLMSGLPNNNPDFDLYSFGPNKVSARPTLTTWQNGIDDDNDVSIDDASDAVFNGRERRSAGGDPDDDINNFKTIH